MPANTTLATLLAEGSHYAPDVAGFTWVANQPQDGPGARRPLKTLARRLRQADPDMAEPLEVASSGATTLYDLGYYDRQRALEARVTKHLPPPSEGWPDLPVYLSADFAILRDVEVDDRQFFRNLDAIEQLIAA